MSHTKKKLMIVTTVPETLATILKGQPGYLQRHFEVTVVTSPGPVLVDISKNEGVPISPVRMHRGISPLRDLVSIVSMVFVIWRLRPHIVHSYTPKAGLVAMIASWLCRVPVRVHTFTGLIFPYRSGAGQRVLIMIDRLICGCATRIIPEGEGVRRDLMKYRITTKALSVVGNGNIAGVNTDHYSRSASYDGLPPIINIDSEADAVTFCYVGRLNRDKGLVELFSAFEQLPECAFLLIVGELDRSAPVDESTLHRLTNHPRIRMLGFQVDIRPALSASDVLVLPSYREGFPNVLLQGGAMCLPCIATDINGCNEIIEPGVNGWLVPARDARSLAGAMLASIEVGAAERQKMGIWARQRIKDRFEQQDHWERMVSLYTGEVAKEMSL